MKTVITTVGTSILENYNTVEVDRCFQDDYQPIGNSLSKIKKKTTSSSNYEDFDLEIGEIKSIVENNWFEGIHKVKDEKGEWRWKKEADVLNINASAEITSILAIAKYEKCDLEIQLIASDTVLSLFSGELIQGWFGTDFQTSDGHKITVKTDIEILEGLQVDDIKKFRKEGLSNLLNVFQKYIIDKTFAPLVTLNITGGYKAFIPYLTILGQLNHVKICYLFEGTEEIIVFPQAPISLDFGIFKEYYTVFQELYIDVKEANWDDYQRKNNLPAFIENFVDIEDFGKHQLFELSAIGKYYFEIFENYFLVNINKGSSVFGEKEGNRQQIISVLKELYCRLQEIIDHNNIADKSKLDEHIHHLGDKNDLRHGRNPNKHIYIFKSTDVAQVRLVYGVVFSNQYLSLKLYDYVRGDFDHSEYIDEFHKKYKFKKEFDFIKIPIKKN